MSGPCQGVRAGARPLSQFTNQPLWQPKMIQLFTNCLHWQMHCGLGRPGNEIWHRKYSKRWSCGRSLGRNSTARAISREAWWPLRGSSSSWRMLTRVNLGYKYGSWFSSYRWCWRYGSDRQLRKIFWFHWKDKGERFRWEVRRSHWPICIWRTCSWRYAYRSRCPWIYQYMVQKGLW